MTVAYVSMPGTSGNYVSTDDVNLLDANTAHIQQSIGQWVRLNASSSSLALAASSAAVFGDNIGKLTVTSATGSGRGLVEDPRPSAGGGRAVTAGSTYSFIISAVSPTKTVTVSVLWWNVANGFIAQPTIGTIPAGSTLVKVAGQVVAPANAVKANFQFGITDANGATTNDEVWFDAALWGAAGVTSFVPSLRIVGDVDMRARFSATDATPASAEMLLSTLSGNNGYAMSLGTGGELVVYHGTGSGTRAETSSGLSLSAATDTEVQSTLDISAGTWTHYKNGVQFDSSGSFATTAGSPSGTLLAVGSVVAGTSGNWDGDIYYAEVRDGIDGPVVRRFDADDLIGLI